MWVNSTWSAVVAGLRELVADAVLERAPGLGQEPTHRHLFLVRGGRQQRQVDLAVEAVLEVGAGAAEGGEAGRPLGHQDLLVGDALGVAGDVQRAAAAVTEQGVVGGAVALAEDAADGLVAAG